MNVKFTLDVQVRHPDGNVPHPVREVSMEYQGEKPTGSKII